jgi:repressor LexA
MMMARKKSKTLSDRQKRILAVLEKFQAENGFPPSIREICDQANISSTSVVNYYLERLQELGYIERERQVSRGIRLLKPLSQVGGTAVASAKKFGQSVEDMLRIPILGRIVAGSPVPVPQSDFSYYDADSMVDIAASMFPGGEPKRELFALEVQGDSMIDAMVYDGDIVILEPSQEARNGEMVAIWLNDRDETTLKYFYLEGGKVRLQPANPTMEPIIINDPTNVEVQGKVVMVIRQVQGLAS